MGVHSVGTAVQRPPVRLPLALAAAAQRVTEVKLIAGAEVGAAGFGNAVALSPDGRTALIGGSVDDHGRGAVWVFIRRGSSWVQQGRTLTSGKADPNNYFGTSVALSADSNTALIGEAGADDRVGAAWMFIRSGSRWARQGKLVGAGEIGAAEFGYDVALSADGHTALIGGPDDDRSKGLVGNTGFGAAWVFTRTGTTWRQQGKKLTGRGETPTGLFGFAVALSASGDAALVGAPNADSRGAAWVFTRTHSSWRQQGGKLFGSGAVGSVVSAFGAAVALSASGDTALISGGDDNNHIGSVWIFRRVGSIWKQLGSKLIPHGNRGQSEFGISVAVSANGVTALIGGWIDHGGRGAAWVFRRSGSTWKQEGEKLTGRSEIGTDSRFGSAVALSADANTALIGGVGDNHKRGAAWAFGSLAR